MTGHRADHLEGRRGLRGLLGAGHLQGDPGQRAARCPGPGPVRTAAGGQPAELRPCECHGGALVRPRAGAGVEFRSS